MKEYGILEECVDLKKYNTYGIGGIARFLIKVYPEKLVALTKYLEREKIPWFILGKGSNVILPDEDFDGVIILLDNFDNIEIKDYKVKVGAGVLLSKLVNTVLNEGYTNLSFLFGIPGSIGGALRGNAGAYHHEIYDYVIDVTILDEEKNIVTLKKEDIKFAYRDTEFKKRNIIILGCTLHIEKGDVLKARDEIKCNLQKRKDTQPLEYKNAGSVFKNPPGLSAGKLIEEAGLKGKRINDAMISEKHANFIVNIADAQSSDIIELIKLVKMNVKRENNIDLELEQIIVKW